MSDRFDSIDDDTLVKAATQALTRPDSFAYSGSVPLFESWGITFSQSRDSEALERSNYRRIYADLLAKFPEDVTDMRAGHWAVGWVEHVLVRVLADADADIGPENITPAFARAASIGAYLTEQYPVYDDSDFSELEYAEQREAFEENWSDMLRAWDDESDGTDPTDAERDLVWDDVLSNESSMYPDNLARMVREVRAG